MTFAFFVTIKINGQNIDSLKLTDKEIPENYSFTNENNCISKCYKFGENELQLTLNYDFKFRFGNEEDDEL